MKGSIGVNQVRQVRLAEKRLRQLMRLLDRDAIDRVKVLLEGAQRDSCAWPNGSGMLYIRARLEEEGAFGGSNNVAALSAFSELASKHDEFYGEALIGRARMLYRTDKEGHLEEIISLCKEVIRLNSSPKAMMILGSVFETEGHDFELASRWYLAAYWNGSPWGLRSYAALQRSNGNLLRSAVAHAATTLTAPFMAVRWGLTGPFK